MRSNEQQALELTDDSHLKVVVVYRVLQAWRVPIFDRLSEFPGIDLTVLYGEDFHGTKVVSYKGEAKFKKRLLKSYNLRLRSKNGRFYIPVSRNLFGAIEEIDPDVIIVEGASNFVNNIICFVYAKLKKVPIIQWGLGEIEGRRRSLLRRSADLVFRRIERHSSAAIAYSSYGAAYYQRVGLPDERIFVAVNVVDTEKRELDLKRYARERGLPLPSDVPKVFNVLFVGAFTENKGIEKLVDAFAEFHLRTPRLEKKLTLVGDGPSRPSIIDRIERKGLKDLASLPGAVNEGISHFYYDASIFIMPGLGGLAVSDALIHGVPVMAGVGDGCEKDLIDNDNNGIFVRDLTRQVIADKLVELSADRTKLVRWRKGAQQFSSGKFTVNNYVTTMVRALRSTQ